jgi:chromate reductase
MPDYRVAVLVGSLRRDSFNARLATSLGRLAPPDFSLSRVQISDLPLYSEDDDNNPTPPVSRLRSEVAAAQGVLFVTPEYNRSLPGVLKNAIDLGSRPYGHSVWARKPAGVLGVSLGAPGTSMAQQHLRNVLAFLDMPTLGQPEVFLQQKEGLFTDADDIGGASRDFLRAWMDRYTSFVRRNAV